jgi:hypothetical protein
MAFAKSALIVISATDYFNLWMWPCEGLCDGAKGKQKGQEGQKRQKSFLPFLPFLLPP